MNALRPAAAIMGLLISGGLWGCAAKAPPALSAATPPAPPRRFHGATAYDVDHEALCRAADVQISLYTCDEMWVDKPQRPLGKMKLDRFLGLLPNLGVGRELAVVLLDKRESPSGVTMGQMMDSVQWEIQKRGFKRVIFRLATSKAVPPIIRDTASSELAWEPPERGEE